MGSDERQRNCFHTCEEREAVLRTSIRTVPAVRFSFELIECSKAEHTLGWIGETVQGSGDASALPAS